MGNKHKTTALDRARDELYSHIHRCGVLDASEEQVQDWMEDTIDFLNKRYPELQKRELAELKQLGLRFCKPVIPHGKDSTAPGEEGANEEVEAEEAKTAPAAAVVPGDATAA